MTNTEQANPLAEAQQNLLNMQSAMGELEQQLKWMSNRCAAMSVERDNIIRYAKQLEEQIKTVSEQTMIHEEVAQLVPVAETVKPPRKVKAGVN